MDEVTLEPVVPGLGFAGRLRSDDHGEVWRAVEQGSGRALTVHVGLRAAGAGAAAREAAQLRRVDHENVARLRSVLDLPEGRRAVVHDVVAHTDLAALVAGRGGLPTGEVVTVAVAVARALAHVHALGLVHGRLSARDVLVADDGRPVLWGVGTASLLAGRSGPATYPVPADDVRALGELLRLALTGGRRDRAVTGPLAAVVELCLAARPSPVRVATLAWEAAPAAPIILPPAEA